MRYTNHSTMNQLFLYPVLLICFLASSISTLQAQCGDSLGWQGIINTFPYDANFANGHLNWYSAPADNLFPASAPTGYANTSRPNTWGWGLGNGFGVWDTCWGTGMVGTSNHAAGEVSHLISPRFDFSGLSAPIISAKISYDLETNVDGAYLEISVDSGKTWTIVGDSATSPFGWYNTAAMNPGTLCPLPYGPAWTGSSNGWVSVQHDLYAYAGIASVQLRFTIHTEYVIHHKGLGVAEILIHNMLPSLSLGPDTTHCGPLLLDAGPGWVSHLWNQGDTAQVISVNMSGTYIVQTMDFLGNVARDTINVLIFPTPIFDLGPDQAVCQSTNVLLTSSPPWGPGATLSIAVYDSSLMQFVPIGLPQPNINLRIDSTSHLEITMIDQNGCTAKDSIIITALDTPVVTTTVQHVTCPGGIGGRMDVSVNGILHNTAFMYSTSIATTLPYIENISSGTYWIDVIDLLGCQARATGTISEPTPITGITNTSSAPNCSTATGPVTLSVAGGTPPYTVSWWHGPIGFTLPGGLVPGNYGLTITDNNLCTENVNITIGAAGSPAATVATTPDFGLNDGTAKATTTGGMSPYSYDWGLLGGGQTADSIGGLSAGSDLLTVTDAANCLFTTPYLIPYRTAVYPGDCNHDQVADMNDLIPIGLKYGDTGPIRPNANTTWTPQIAPLWGDTLPNGIDVRHVDTDGNGTINDDDTLAITLNYGSTHNNLRPAASGGPKLHFMMPTQNLIPGDTITVPIFLGTIDTPVVNLYGIAFSVNYDSSKVEAFTAETAFPTSWLGTPGTNMLSLDHDLYTMERIDMGLVRTDHMAVNGFGHIADLIVVIDDHIAKRDVPFHLSFSNVFAVDAGGEQVEVSHEPGEAVIKVTTGIDEALDKVLGMDVDPAQGLITLNHLGHQLTSVSLYDLQGRCLCQAPKQQVGQTVLVVGEIAAGTYFLEIHTTKGRLTKKLIWLGE